MNNIIFLPLDIPKIPFNNEMTALFQGKEQYDWWQEDLLVGNKDYSKPLGFPEPWNDISKNYQPLIDHILKYLPFEYISYFRLARAREEVGVHVDDSYVNPPLERYKPITKELKDHHLKNEPIGYRLILNGSRDTFYFCKEYDPTYKTKIDQPKYYVTIPETTDFFLIRNYQQPHGVDINEQDHNRIVGFIIGKVDEGKHKQIIEKSITKYKDYMLTELK